MRQIILDTETTGLDPNQGHRIIEVAGVEMVNRQLTGNHFHRYINPDREIDLGAQQVHGLSLEFLQDKPRFRDIADELLEYLQGAELVIHNAPFDVGFLNRELGLLDQPLIGHHCPSVVDTLKMAKDLHPGQKNNLDALCRRYEVDNSGRTLHGALLDAELLAEVYLAMTRGQDSLIIEIEETKPSSTDSLDGIGLGRSRNLTVLAATPEEAEAHRQYLDALDKAAKGVCLWRQLESGQEMV